jgi:hypothetical protein
MIAGEAVQGVGAGVARLSPFETGYIVISFWPPLRLDRRPPPHHQRLRVILNQRLDLCRVVAAAGEGSEPAEPLSEGY